VPSFASLPKVGAIWVLEGLVHAMPTSPSLAAIKCNNRNIHPHILLTQRELRPHGFGEIANTRSMTRKRIRGEVLARVAGIAVIRMIL
jgi:hypothetical protein